METREFNDAWYALVPRLEAFAKRRFSMQKADVEDTLQELALLALSRHKRGYFRDASHFEGWCRKAYFSRCIDSYRNRRSSTVSGWELDQTPDDQTTPDDPSEELAKVIKQLPPRQREIIARYLNGETTEAIANSLELSAAGVRSLKRFAVANLRQKLTEENDE